MLFLRVWMYVRLLNEFRGNAEGIVSVSKLPAGSS